MLAANRLQRPKPLAFLKPARRSLQHRPPQRWYKVLFKNATSTRLVLCMLLFIAARVLLHNSAAIMTMLHDPTAPSTVFKSYQIGETGIVLRPWKWPAIFEIESGLTKQHARARPIPELRGGRRPASYDCERTPEAPLLFIGVFSTASRWSRRALLREYEKPMGEFVNGARVEFKFILGRPKEEEEMRNLTFEAERHKDIIILDDEENMNNGKTYAFYRYLAKRPGAKPQFAFKADDDALLVITNMVDLLRKLDCRSLYYMGTCFDFTCGMNRGFPPYFTGMAYGLSAPVYQWIGDAELGRRKMRGMEDVRTGQFMLNIDEKKGEKLIRLHLDGRMGEWRHWRGTEWNFNPETVLVIHGMKKEEHLKKLKEKLGSKLGPAKQIA